jgi:hypothetical protein
MVCLFNEAYLKTLRGEWHDGLVNDALGSIWKWPWPTWDLAEFIGRGWRKSRWMSGIVPVTSGTQAGAPELEPACSVLWSMEQAECSTLYRLNWHILQLRSHRAISTHYLGYKNQSLMPHREIIAVFFSEIYWKQILCGQSVEFLAL